MSDVMETVLVTGGAGFIGSHLVDALLKDGHPVIALDDLSTGSLRNIQHLIGHRGFRFELGSVLDRQRCQQAIAEADVVVHLAAAVGVKLVFERPIDTIERNVRGTEHVLEGALRHGRKVFLASTSEVYGKETPDGSPVFRETDDVTLGVSMRWSYACSKALDEYLARAYHQTKGLPVVIGRLFNTVGPRQTGAYGMVIPRFVDWALAGTPIRVYGDGRQVRVFAHVHDTVRALWALMNEPRAEGQIVNIGGVEPVTMLELARRIKALTRSDSEIVLVPYEQAFGAGFEDIRLRVPDLARLQELVGYRPAFSLDAILRDMVEDGHSRLDR
jgi:nucleoside-diphosphate-sugar epimerase